MLETVDISGMTSGLVVRNNQSGIADKTLEQSCLSRLNCYSAARNAVSRSSNPWTYCAHFLANLYPAIFHQS